MLASSVSGEKSGRLFIRPLSVTAAHGRSGPIASPPAFRRSSTPPHEPPARPLWCVRDANSARPPNWQFPGPTWGPPRLLNVPVSCICNRAAARAAHRRQRRHLRILTCPAALPPQITQKRAGDLGAWGGLIRARCGTLLAGARFLPVAQDRTGRNSARCQSICTDRETPCGRGPGAIVSSEADPPLVVCRADLGSCI